MRHEDLARDRVGLACGVHVHPVQEVTSVRLDDFEVRVKPDDASHRVSQSSKVILEIKCQHSKNMRNQIGARMLLHARRSGTAGGRKLPVRSEEMAAISGGRARRATSAGTHARQMAQHGSARHT